MEEKQGVWIPAQEQSASVTRGTFREPENALTLTNAPFTHHAPQRQLASTLLDLFNVNASLVTWETVLSVIWSQNVFKGEPHHFILFVSVNIETKEDILLLLYCYNIIDQSYKKLQCIFERILYY